MSWLGPLKGAKPMKKPRTPDTSRRIVLDGKEYRSLTAAAQALGVSITSIYKRIGEGHRFHVKRREG